jgi:hypothetical protein
MRITGQMSKEALNFPAGTKDRSRHLRRIYEAPQECARFSGL